MQDSLAELLAQINIARSDATVTSLGREQILPDLVPRSLFVVRLC